MSSQPFVKTHEQMTADASGRLLEPKEAAELLGVAPDTLRYWRYEGRGPKYVKYSQRCFRYDEADVRRYIDEHRIDLSARTSLERHATRS